MNEGRCPHERSTKWTTLRQIFTLFILFDFMSIFFVWLTYAMLSDKNIMSVVYREIIQFDIKTSSFDEVTLSAVRFLILLFFYSCFGLKNYYMVLMTTSLSSVLLVYKIMIFEWKKVEYLTFPLTLVILSFFGSWVELWLIMWGKFLTSRPRLEQCIYRISSNHGRRSLESSSFYTMKSSSTDLATDHSEDNNDNFEYEFRTVYLNQSNEIFNKTMELYSNNKSWMLEKKQKTDTICSKIVNDLKISRLTAVINVNPTILYEILYLNIQETPTWNPNVTESFVVHKFNDFTDITYLLSPGMKGFVSSREFLSLRNYALRDGCYIISTCSIEHSMMPISEKYIRAENKISSFVIEPKKDNNKSCTLYWYLNTNINGNVPSFLVNSRLPIVMFDFIDNLRSYVQNFTC